MDHEKFCTLYRFRIAPLSRCPFHKLDERGTLKKTSVFKILLKNSGFLRMQDLSGEPDGGFAYLILRVC